MGIQELEKVQEASLLEREKHVLEFEKRLKDAYDYFTNEVEAGEWVKLFKVLINAKVMVYSVQDSADATLIFELQNFLRKNFVNLTTLNVSGRGVTCEIGHNR